MANFKQEFHGGDRRCVLAKIGRSSVIIPLSLSHFTLERRRSFQHTNCLSPLARPIYPPTTDRPPVAF